MAALESGRKAMEYTRKLSGGAIGEQKLKRIVPEDYQKLNLAATSVRFW